ncbi:ATP-dependent RNA helicase DeaD [Anaerosphaera aminiphila DSM 21120]|uniref:ATP-dependent RNA helicase CshA n=1 Tax=Anaerosphaera aminiphila DSM 21120 TaxID=1120995 RepID=A0A1M5QUQ9_9FIRM|nr:DEAD/DEAH box helicase [Anaerosphaera aminiphila]SHH17490.1 ATP-dependent RNA helicase DeaD [Anaerosphaera aminiphila DSM 21120]
MKKEKERGKIYLMTEQKFENFNLSEEVVKAVSDMGFEELSLIQEQAIPYLMEGEDVIGQAQTGTGKTAAFGIPIVEKVDSNSNDVQALVLCPTRELCIQVSEEISKLAKYKVGLRVLPIYGGQPIDRQLRALKKGVQIVIGTPGRVIDHIKRRTLKTNNIKMFVLDEADEMFDMGFRDDIELILKDVPEDRQSLFFSATMDKNIMKFAKKYQKDPKIVQVVKKELTVPKVTQFYYELKSSIKTEVLSRVLDIYNPKLTVVFCNTKKKVDELTGELQGRGYFADGLHGDLKQGQRDVVMSKFRRGSIDILVATDVAARGIDVDDVDLVVNYDMPQDNEYYVHRIGRTARAGREGTAISFVTGRDYNILRDIEKYTKTNIDRKTLPTLKDIEVKQSSKIIETIRGILEEGELEKQIEIVSLLEGEEYSPTHIAAAILKLYSQENRLDGHQEIDAVDNKNKSDFGRDRRNKPDNNRRDRDRRDRKGGDFKNDRKPSRTLKNSTRIFLNVGKKKGVSPKHILAALCNDAEIPSKDVGNIDVFDKFTFVDISEKSVDKVVAKLNNKHINGSKVNVEKANTKDN